LHSAIVVSKFLDKLAVARSGYFVKDLS